jgi:hypothetical protein
MAKPKTTPAQPATAKPRKQREKAMTLVEKHKIISRIIDSEPSMPDATLADLVGASFGRKVSASQVAQWRKQFGLVSVPRPTVAQLQSHIEALQQQVRARGDEPVPMPKASEASKTAAMPV